MLCSLLVRLPRSRLWHTLTFVILLHLLGLMAVVLYRLDFINQGFNNGKNVQVQKLLFLPLMSGNNAHRVTSVNSTGKPGSLSMKNYSAILIKTISKGHMKYPSFVGKEEATVGPRPLKATKFPLITKPYVCKGCFVRPYRRIYITQPLDICASWHDTSAELDMVVMVVSRPTNRQVRDVIRRTWLSVSRNNTNLHVRHVFLLGVSDTPQELINAEQHKNNDIVQQNFVDSYKNLTLKTLMGLEWVVDFCSNAKFIFKVDEDVFVNIPKFLEFSKTTNASNFVLGQCMADFPMRGSKAYDYMPRWEFPDPVYPAHCKGPRYLVPLEAARAILKVTVDTPFLRLEDVYVGMCLSKTTFGVKHIPNLDTPVPLRLTTMNCTQFNNITSNHGLTLTYEFPKVWSRCNRWTPCLMVVSQTGLIWHFFDLI